MFLSAFWFCSFCSYIKKPIIKWNELIWNVCLSLCWFVILCKNDMETIVFLCSLSYGVKVVAFLVLRVSWVTAVSCISLFIENCAFGMVESSNFMEFLLTFKIASLCLFNSFFEIVTSKLIFYFLVGPP